MQRRKKIVDFEAVLKAQLWFDFTLMLYIETYIYIYIYMYTYICTLLSKDTGCNAQCSLAANLVIFLNITTFQYTQDIFKAFSNICFYNYKSIFF